MIVNNIELKNFIDLSDNEKSTILTWRNHNKVKKWMYTNEDISFENHLKFIESLKNDISREYFLIKKDMQMLGVIYFTAINYKLKECEFGLYANIEFKRMGNILLNTVCEYAFNILNVNKLIAEVFVENEKAINLYKTFNFKEMAKKIVKNQEIIHMELKNENSKL